MKKKSDIIDDKYNDKWVDCQDAILPFNEIATDNWFPFFLPLFRPRRKGVIMWRLGGKIGREILNSIIIIRMRTWIKIESEIYAILISNKHYKILIWCCCTNTNVFKTLLSNQDLTMTKGGKTCKLSYDCCPWLGSYLGLLDKEWKPISLTHVIYPEGIYFLILSVKSPVCMASTNFCTVNQKLYLNLSLKVHQAVG